MDAHVSQLHSKATQIHVNCSACDTARSAVTDSTGCAVKWVDEQRNRCSKRELSVCGQWTG